MQKLKGLWIPAEILLNKDLSDKEKIILSMILYLSEEKGSCFASNKYKLKHIEEPILKFDNFNFKLCIIQELMYNKNVLLPKFDAYDFVDNMIKEKLILKKKDMNL